jgi:hypothetical protein
VVNLLGSWEDEGDTSGDPPPFFLNKARDSEGLSRSLSAAALEVGLLILFFQQKMLINPLFFSSLSFYVI